MKLFKAMSVPTLLLGSELCVQVQKYLNKNQSEKINILRIVQDYTVLDTIRNEDIRRGVDNKPI